MSDRSNRIERAVLYFVVLVLAIAVGVLAFVRVLNGQKPAFPVNGPF